MSKMGSFERGNSLSFSLNMESKRKNSDSSQTQRKNSDSSQTQIPVQQKLSRQSDSGHHLVAPQRFVGHSETCSSFGTIDTAINGDMDDRAGDFDDCISKASSGFGDLEAPL